MTTSRTETLSHENSPVNLFTTFGFVDGPAIVTAIVGPIEALKYKRKVGNNISDHVLRVTSLSFTRIYIAEGERLEVAGTSQGGSSHVLFSGFRVD